MMNKIIALLFLLVPAAAYSLDDGQILIDGPEVDLTLGELRMALRSAPENVLKLLLVQPKKIREVMDSTYMAKVAATRARKKGLDKDPVVAAQIWKFTNNILAEAEIADVQKQLVKNADYETVAKELYISEKDRLKVPETFVASHILLSAEAGESEEQLLERAKTLRQQLAEGKLDFKEAAKQYSKDTGSAEAGGSLGKFNRGRMVKPFEEALLALKPGEISDPVKTRFGYHIILLEEHTPAHTKPFSEVKEALVQKAKNKVAHEIKVDYWLKVKNDPEARVNEDVFKAFADKPIVTP
ncbi:peptidylprolyl isomerase [Thiolapillus sp.]